jgi:hypothetical protein
MSNPFNTLALHDLQSTIKLHSMVSKRHSLPERQQSGRRGAGIPSQLAAICVTYRLAKRECTEPLFFAERNKLHEAAGPLRQSACRFLGQDVVEQLPDNII